MTWAYSTVIPVCAELNKKSYPMSFRVCVRHLAVFRHNSLRNVFRKPNTLYTVGCSVVFIYKVRVLNTVNSIICLFTSLSPKHRKLHNMFIYKVWVLNAVNSMFIYQVWVLNTVNAMFIYKVWVLNTVNSIICLFTSLSPKHCKLHVYIPSQES